MPVVNLDTIQFLDRQPVVTPESGGLIVQLPDTGLSPDRGFVRLALYIQGPAQCGFLRAQRTCGQHEHGGQYPDSADPLARDGSFQHVVTFCFSG